MCSPGGNNESHTITRPLTTIIQLKVPLMALDFYSDNTCFIEFMLLVQTKCNDFKYD